MKNIHVLPTEKRSRFSIKVTDGFQGFDFHRYNERKRNTWYRPQHIYITSDEEIKDEDYCVHINQSSIIKIGKGEAKLMKGHLYLKKIILTTDQDLIADGVQAIDDEFLEWFAQNPSCEEVKTRKIGNEWIYNADVPQAEPKQETLKAAMYILQNSTYGAMGKVCDEEPKQETVEEAANRLFYTVGNEGISSIDSFMKGAEWQAEQDKKKYSEKDLREAFSYYYADEDNMKLDYDFKEWFEQFKKK